MSWIPCATCHGSEDLQDNCKDCYGNGGAFEMPPRITPLLPPPATEQGDPVPPTLRTGVRRG